MAMLGAQTLWRHLPERLSGPPRSAPLGVPRAGRRCIPQWLERAYQSASEEVRRWVWNQPNTPEDPSWRFRLTVFSMDIVGTTMRSSWSIVGWFGGSRRVIGVRMTGRPKLCRLGRG